MVLQTDDHGVATGREPDLADKKLYDSRSRQEPCIQDNLHASRGTGLRPDIFLAANQQPKQNQQRTNPQNNLRIRNPPKQLILHRAD